MVLGHELHPVNVPTIGFLIARPRDASNHTKFEHSSERTIDRESNVGQAMIYRRHDA